MLTLARKLRKATSSRVELRGHYNDDHETSSHKSILWETTQNNIFCLHH